MLTRGRMLYFALALLFAISLTYRIREIIDRVDLLSHGAERAKEPFNMNVPGVEITGVEPEAAAAGIQKGDTLLAFAERPYRGAVDFYVPLREARPGDRMNVQVRSADGAVRNSTIEMQPFSVAPPGASKVIQQVVAIAMPVFCILLGFWVAAVRIRDPRAWILLAMMISFGETVGGGLFRSMFGYDDIFQPIGAASQQFAGNVWSIAMMLFGIYFPERFGPDRRWPWAKWLLIGPLLFRASQNGISAGLAGKHVTLAITIDRFLPVGANTVTVVHMAAISCFFFAIANRSARAANPDARRRLSLLHAGATISMTPIFLLIVVNLILGRAPIPNDSAVLTFVVLLMLLGFPLTMAYVIVVQRAMDVRVVVRQGVQYLLASRGVLFLQALLSAMVIFAAGSLTLDGMNRPQRIRLMALGVTSVALIQVFAKKTRTWIDRRFFREAYDAEQILSDLANKVRTMVETGPLLETVANRISESLHVPRVAVLLNGGGAFEVAYAVGYSTPPDVRIPANGTAIEKAAQE